MAVKLTGKEFKEFLNDAQVWDDQRWYEDLVIKVNGITQDEDWDTDTNPLADLDKVTIVAGHVVAPEGTVRPICAILQKWLHERDNTRILITVNKKQEEQLRQRLISVISEFDASMT